MKCIVVDRLKILVTEIVCHVAARSLQFCCGALVVSFDVPISWPRDLEDYKLNVQAEF
jgi:hypothetical protein